MNNNAFEVLAEGSEEGQLLGMDFFKFTGLVPDAKVSIQDRSFSKTDYPSIVSLLACSGKYGYFVAGHVEGFVFGQTQSLRAAVYATEKGSTSTLTEKTVVPLTSPVHQLRLSSDELTVLVALSDGSILSYSVIDLQEQKENAQPKYTISLGTPIVDLRPNTEALPDSACVLLKDHQCRIINWKSGETIATIPGSDFSAICWSPKGKQVVCGRLDGTLEHYDLTGVKKDFLNSPESMQSGYGDENVNRNVQDVLWIENHQFLVLYSRPTEPDNDEFINDAYIIDRKPKNGTGPKYTHLAEVTPIFSPEGRSNHFYMETIRNFGAQSPHVVILANGATNEVSVVGEDENGDWATWDLPENGMASLPLSEETNCDTFPLGLALDYSASEKLPPYDASESDVGVEPVPVLFHLNDEGHIGSYHCYNDHFASSGAKYQGMTVATTPSAADAAASTSNTPPPSTTAPEPTTTSAFDTKPASSLSSSAFSSSAFGMALNSGSAGTKFASLTKVQGATNPSHGFGSSSGFGSLAQNKVPNAVTPTFGSTSGFGAAAGTATSFGSAATPAFGTTTSFGSMTKKDDAPVFGSTGGFGSTEKKTTTPTFGTTTATGFGSTTEKKQPVSGFGSTGFGSTGFGSTGFGSTGFGSPAKKSDTSLPFSAPGFGNSTTTDENNGSATPKSGSTSSFEIVTKSDTNQDNNDKETDEKESGDLGKKDVTADVPSFGSLAIGDQEKQNESKQDATGQKDEEKTTEQEVGQEISDTSETDEKTDNESKKAAETTTSKKDEATAPDASATKTTGFGASAKDSIPGAGTLSFGSTSTLGSGSTFGAPATTSSASGFGALAKNTVPGATAPAFGSTSTLGGSTPGGFGALAKNTVPGATAPAFGSTSTLGGSTPGGFGALAKNTVPGATAPAFGSTSTLGGSAPGGFGALAKNTVPGATAPAFGSTSTLGGSAPGGFGALAKNTVPGATAPAFGSTSTLGSGSAFGSSPGGFGDLAKKTVPGAVTPGFGPTSTFDGASNKAAGGFGTTTPTEKQTTPSITPPLTTEPAKTEPVAKQVISSTDTTPKASAATSQSITQPTPLKYATPEEKQESTKGETVKEPSSVPKPEPKEEGMAKQFEALYFKITSDLEKLSSVQGEFEKQLQTQNKQLATMNKTVEDLTGDLKQWRLGECSQLASVVEEIANKLKKNDIITDQKEQVARLELKTSELMNRKNQIVESMNAQEDDGLRALLADRELDDATREECESLELRCKATGELVGELEYRIINKTSQQRKPLSQTDTSKFSFYDFHCAIRNVERDLKRKDAEMKDLEQKLLLLKFKEHQHMAEKSPSAITFEDLSDDEYADAVSFEGSSERNTNIEGRFGKQHIDYTVKCIQDEQVMDKLCTEISQRSPFNVNANAPKK